MKELKYFLNYELKFNDAIKIDVKSILLLIVVLILMSVLLKFFKKFLVRKLAKEDKNKFDTMFSFISWLIYVVVFFSVLHTSGVNLSAILAASAALLIGVGLALQTFFQDILSGVFIILDKSLRVGDIIEIENKVGRVLEIKLRTTRAVTMDDKVIVIPNHLYLTNSLYNWTQNGSSTRENVSVGVAYGSDTALVKSLLIRAANEHLAVLKDPPPMVLFSNFGESSLDFQLIFTLTDSFKAVIPKSDIRFKIDKLFRENNISIPFPQRDVHVIKKSL